MAEEKEEKKAPDTKDAKEPQAAKEAKKEKAKPAEAKAAEVKTAEGKPAEAKKRKLVKGRHHSAIKRHRQSLKRAVQNRATLSAMKTAVKKVHQAVTSKDKGLAQTQLKTAMSLLHRAASHGVIHHRNASRQIARLSQRIAKAA